MNNTPCESCVHYSALREPRVRSDGATIYGYCFKYGDKDYSWNMSKGFAVFLPEGPCKDYKRDRNKPEPQMPEQLGFEEDI